MLNQQSCVSAMVTLCSISHLKLIFAKNKPSGKVMCKDAQLEFCHTKHLDASCQFPSMLQKKIFSALCYDAARSRVQHAFGATLLICRQILARLRGAWNQPLLEKPTSRLQHRVSLSFIIFYPTTKLNVLFNFSNDFETFLAA